MAIILKIARLLGGANPGTAAERLLGAEASGLAIDFLTNTYANRTN
jgi:hypothetical protein